jgi:hypothetical protein
MQRVAAIEKQRDAESSGGKQRVVLVFLHINMFLTKFRCIHVLAHSCAKRGFTVTAYTYVPLWRFLGWMENLSLPSGVGDITFSLFLFNQEK